MKIISDFTASLHKFIDRRIINSWYPAGTPIMTASTGSASPAGPWALLRSASRIYEKLLRKDQARRRKKRVRLPAPVISIGNLSAGGTGKTPLTIWMCEFLITMGFHPAILTRGYGGRGKDPGRIPVHGDSSALYDFFGDEPVMISEHLPSVPVWVGKDRAESGWAALEHNAADVLVLDDGFQHLALDRDLDMVLLDCRSPFGNGFVLPAGPLREPVSNLKRADVFVITHADMNAEALKNYLKGLFPAIPAFTCRHKIKGFSLGKGEPLLHLDAFSNRRAVAFAGIAGPQGFFEDLRNAGIRICSSLSFPDHHRYSPDDISKIFFAASEQGANVVITTAKDAVRIPLGYTESLAIAEIGIEFGPDHEAFCSLILTKLGMAKGLPILESENTAGKRP